MVNHFSDEILFRVTYLAPEGSNYCNIECFESLETVILNFTSNNYKLCLLGDFNAHTSDEYDFICVDDNIQQSLDLWNTEACIGVLEIWDICHFTSRDMGYMPFYFQ